MAQITRTELVPVPRRNFYDAIVRYESYPEFVPHIVSARILDVDGARSRVHFTAHYLRDITYTLDLFHDEPKGIRWELVESPLLRVSSGSWELRHKSKSSTEIVYAVDVVPRILVPSGIVSALTRNGLPTMIHAFVTRAAAQRLASS